jgi:hypothetical protein
MVQIYDWIEVGRSTFSNAIHLGHGAFTVNAIEKQSSGSAYLQMMQPFFLIR